MKTIIEKANDSAIQKAAEIIKRGGLVAFPTETVYGLGANAFDSTAVKKIYTAKGRPSDNPLIVHIGDKNFLNEIVKDINSDAEKLIEKFWPGPLTIIFNKKECIPPETSGGLNTIAIRFPANNIAQKLINLAKVPIAAPSANISGKPSCTLSSHVIDDLNGKVDMILCGNDFFYGLESTIIDMTVEIPKILRPGAITFEMIKKVLDKVEIEKNLISEHPKAPGMKYKHYAPNADVFIFDANQKNIFDKINELISQNSDKKIGVLACDQTKHLYKNCFVLSLGNQNNPTVIAQNFFAALRTFDAYGIEIIYAESFAQNGICFAIMNRLLKAANYKFINA